MKNIPEQFDFKNPESVELEDFFRFKEEEGDKYSEIEQKLLCKYIEQMKELKEELGLKKFEDLKLEGFDKKKLPQLRKLKAILDKISEAMQKHYFSDVISGMTEKGERISFEIKEQLERWRKFYQEHNIDWVDLPEEIKITEEQQKEMARVIKELAPEKADDIEILIIPEGLADDEDKYEALHKEMTIGYAESYLGENFKKEGGFRGLKNKSDELRIIITKKVKNLKDDKVFKKTLDKSFDDLEGEEGIFKKKGLKGLDMMTYLIWQRKYFEATGGHLDITGWIRITENERSTSGHIPQILWSSSEGRMLFDSYGCEGRSDYHGCRLAGTFEIES